MKKLLLLLCLLFPLFISAQHDFQWMVFDGKLKFGESYQPLINTDPNTRLLIDSLAIPDTSISDSASNDFFVIYDDGSFYLSNRTGTNSDVNRLNFVDSTTAYVFDNSASINYLYLTNRYENDDPKKRVQTTHNNNPNSLPQLREPISPNLSNINNTHSKITHQTPVVGADIVFIINPNDLPNSDCKYRLCIDDPEDQFSFQPLSFNSFDQDLNFGVNNALVYENQNFIEKRYNLDQENCVFLGEIQGNTFIKFRVNGDIDSLVQGTINYSLNSRKEECSIEPFFDVVDPTGHDPNFVQLKCVWEEEGTYYARYKVQCYNDDPDNNVNNLKMTLNLPDFVNTQSIEYKSWMVNDQFGCGTSLYSGLKQQSLNGQELIVDFRTGLDVYNNSDQQDSINLYTGYFEFITEILVSPGQYIYTMPLNLNSPFTNFDADTFAITPFIEETSCLSPNIIDIIIPDRRFVTDYKDSLYCIQGRTLSNCSNDCPTPCSFSCWLLRLLGIILIIYLSTRLLKKRS